MYTQIAALSELVLLYCVRNRYVYGGCQCLRYREEDEKKKKMIF